MNPTNLFSLVLAQEGGSGLASLIFLGVMAAVFYMLIIRPQRRRAQAQQQLSESLQAGDEVRTIGGIHGSVISVDETSVLLKVEDGRIRVAKRAIGARVGDEN